MNSKQMKCDWGIYEGDEYLPEFLLDNFPENCFFVDSLPKPVGLNRDKFDQTEDVFYMDLKNKIKNILIKLWMYNDVYFESKLFYEAQTTQAIKIKSPEIFDEFQRLSYTFGESSDKKIENVKQLTFLIELSHQDFIDISFFFEEYRIILIPSWSCYFAFVKEQANLDAIEKIINVEGLYLRRKS